MPGIYKTVVNTRKFSKYTAVGIGVLLSIPLLLFGGIMAQNVFTRANDVAPRDVTIAEVSEKSGTDIISVIKITWTTGQETTDSTIKYGTSPTDLRFFAPEKSKEKTTTHEAEITLFSPSTRYYFKILSNGEEYGNDEVPWEFTTKARNGSIPQPTLTDEQLQDPLLTPEPTIPGGTTISPTPTTAVGAKTTPFPTLPFVLSATCKQTTCLGIRTQLGKTCSIADYQRCIVLTPSVPITPSTTPFPSNTPAPTSIPPSTTPTPTGIAITANDCALIYLQTSASNSCNSWVWDSMDTHIEACRKAFNRYSLQCKNNSFVPTPNVTPPTDVWYYKNVLTNISSNSATLTTAPTTGTVYCQVRAEDSVGGDSHSTPWVRKSCDL